MPFDACQTAAKIAPLLSAPGAASVIVSALQLLVVTASVIIALRSLAVSRRAQALTSYTSRMAAAYNLFTREWKDKVLAPAITFYRRTNAATGAIEILSDDAGRRLMATQAERYRNEAIAPQPQKFAAIAGTRPKIALASSEPQSDGGDHVERVELATRQMVRREIRRQYNLNRIAGQTKVGNLGPVPFGDDIAPLTLPELHARMERFWRNSQTTGRWEKDATYVLTQGLQDLGSYVRVGAVPLNQVFINGARLIVEEWAYCMGRVYGDFRRGNGNITFESMPDDRFVGALRRHAEWLACASAIYWARVYRKGYVNFFILEMEAELIRQHAVQKTLRRNKADVDAALAAGNVARDARLEQSAKQPGGFLARVGDITHIRERELILRHVDDQALVEELGRDLTREFGEFLDPGRERPRARAPST